MIRNARIFKAALPQNHRTLAEEVGNLPYAPLEPGQVKTQGFIPHPVNGEPVVPFRGGYAFMLRTDERIIPPSVVSAELDALEKREGRKLTRQERIEVKEDIIFRLAKTALYRTRYTPAYFLAEAGYLIIDSAAKKPAQELVGRLVQVMESLETQTIHVSDVARGLSTKLHEELAPEVEEVEGLDGEFAGFSRQAPFGAFSLGDAVKLKRPGASETVTYAGVELTGQSAEITDQLRHGFRAIELRLHLEETEFKLCNDFSLKSFSFPENELSEADQEAAEDDPMVRWLADVQLETAAIQQIVDGLVELLRYEEPEAGEEAA